MTSELVILFFVLLSEHYTNIINSQRGYKPFKSTSYKRLINIITTHYTEFYYTLIINISAVQ